MADHCRPHSVPSSPPARECRALRVRLVVTPVAVRSGLVWIDLALYSSSISLSAACSGERHALVGSGGVKAASRSMAMR